jgi:hypothetical protein
MAGGGFATGLSAAGAAYPGAELQWQKILQGRQALQAAARFQQQQEAMFANLISPAGAAMPQQGPPGMSSPMPSPPGASAAPGPPPGGMPPMQPNGYPVGSGPMGPGPQAYPPGGGGQPPAPPMQRPQPPQPGGPGPAFPGGGPQGPMTGSATAAPFPATAGAAAGGGPPAATGPGGGGLQMPDPMARLRQMAQSLARSNPQLAATPEGRITLMGVLQQQVEMVRGLAPDDRAEMQAEVKVMQIQQQAETAIRNANGREQVAQIKADTASAIADARLSAYRDAYQTASADRRRGQDFAHEDREGAEEGRDARAGAAEQGRNQRAGAAEAGRNARAAARIDASGASAQVRTQYKQLAAKRAALKDQISAFNQGSPGAPSRDEAAKAQAALTQVNDQLVKLWSANRALPKPSELDAGGGGAGAGAGAVGGRGGAGARAPGAGAAPSGTGGEKQEPPFPAEEQMEGQTATGPDGSQWIVQGRQWREQPAAPQ